MWGLITTDVGSALLHEQATCVSVGLHATSLWNVSVVRKVHSEQSV